MHPIGCHVSGNARESNNCATRMSIAIRVERWRVAELGEDDDVGLRVVLIVVPLATLQVFRSALLFVVAS